MSLNVISSEGAFSQTKVTKCWTSASTFQNKYAEVIVFHLLSGLLCSYRPDRLVVDHAVIELCCAFVDFLLIKFLESDRLLSVFL